ncbi:hypothetical protein SSX86_013007 [Deinandra increscens subsp. villosa]|uniref:Protein kinase domain-containing protein n=1 Tax=Deinandra increscens subsp. villosa TaxID=3103831 RepID=A0AAP0D5A7_9ASTR
MAGLKESQHLTLPFKEIEVATQNFLTCIGKGGYGQLSQSGYLAIEGAPAVNQPVVIQPIAIPAVQVGSFKKIKEVIEAAPTDTEPMAVQSIGVPALQIDELNESTNNFAEPIGKGFFGTVYLGVLRSGQAAAIKWLISNAQQEKEFLTQVSTVSRLKHDNVIELLGFCINGRSRYLAYEYASHGSLEDILHGRKGVKGTQPNRVLSWSQRVKIAVGAAKGLQYLHETAEPQIIHRDITSGNVLLFDDHVAKIGDFDLNRDRDMSEHMYSTCVFNFGSHAPEYASTGELNSKSDVYSFGVVLLELLTGRRPVDCTLPRGKQSLVTWAKPKLSEDKVKECVDSRLNGKYPPKAAAKMAAVAALCLKSEPESRPDMNIVVKALEQLLNLSQTTSPSKVSHLSVFMSCCRRPS